MITTLNYNLCFTLYPVIYWAVNLNKKACYVLIM